MPRTRIRPVPDTRFIRPALALLVALTASCAAAGPGEAEWPPLAKKWFVSSAMGWSIGLTPAKDLLEALEGDGLAKKNYIETVWGRGYVMRLAGDEQAAA